MSNCTGLSYAARVAVLLLLSQGPSISYANDAPPPPGARAAGASESTGSQEQGVPPSNAETPPEVGAGLQEVVVTAQRRAERALDVPLSVTTLNTAALQEQGIKQMVELTQAVPGLIMDRQGGGLQPAIRGITTQVQGPGSDTNVAIYVDNVYQPVSSANNFRLPDISQIEVLKGPQGTLFGRNATGGAIRIFTQGPSFTPTGKFWGSYGSFNDIQVGGFVAGPLYGDKLAASLSVSAESNDGYDVDLLRGGKANPLSSRMMRGKLLWVPLEGLKVEVNAYHSYLSDASAFTGIALGGNSVARLVGGGEISAQPHINTTDTKPFETTKLTGGGVHAEWDAGFADVSSTTSYMKFDLPYAVDADYSTLPLAAYLGSKDDERNFQQELLLSSKGHHAIDWVVGAFFYRHRTLSLLDVPLAPSVAFGLFDDTTTTARAVFGEAVWNATDRLAAVFGYRYSWETANLNAINGVNSPRDPPFPNVGNHTWYSGTPRVSLRYTPFTDTNVYATYSEGFKSGLFDISTFAQVNPEKLKAYEVGFKTRAIPRVSLDTAAYYYDYRNQQVQTDSIVDGVSLATVANAASSQSYGLEVSALADLGRGFGLSSGLSLLRSKFRDFQHAAVDVPTGLGGNALAFIDASGKTGVRSPKWTLSLSPHYTFDPGAGPVDISVTAYHSDRIFYEYANRISQAPYTTLDARIEWTALNSGWRIALSGKNLTNRDYITGTFISDNADGVTYSVPRVVQASAEYSF